MFTSVEKLLFHLLNKHFLSSSGVPGSRCSTVTAAVLITTTVSPAPPSPLFYDVPSIMLSPLQTQSHLILTTVR